MDFPYSQSHNELKGNERICLTRRNFRSHPEPNRGTAPSKNSGPRLEITEQLQARRSRVGIKHLGPTSAVLGKCGARATGKIGADLGG